MDPPWYKKYMDQFFIQALNVIKENGFIFVSIPPVWTRPGILEREDYGDGSFCLIAIKLKKRILYFYRFLPLGGVYLENLIISTDENARFN